MSRKLENNKHRDFTTDHPIHLAKDDKFQRYPFSKRIAQTIIKQSNIQSLVFGIFGEWGEGKTSVLNFIKNEIDENSNGFVQISFNPWRFPDETTLLKSFFTTLASEIMRNMPPGFRIEEPPSRLQKFGNWVFSRFRKSDPLKKNSELLGALIARYAQVATIVGKADAAESVGKTLSEVDIETLKERIEAMLSKAKRRIIVYIDDIDRLDKTEIHAVFRLVKLTGDFAYTTYILSFDEEMVAAAIGSRFGSGDTKAGMNFIEKIIQVPLHIPKASEAALKRFCFEKLEEILDLEGITLSATEASRFVHRFENDILIRLRNPRLAVRYTNSLSFLMPLLNGEVNLVDLLLIEAIKIFYPSYYDFVKSNSSYFLRNYRESGENASERVDAIKNRLNKLAIEQSLSEMERTCVERLLKDLFPVLINVHQNKVHHTHDYEQWVVDKRIASSRYFDRFFSYVVATGEISDTDFVIWLEDLANTSNTDQATLAVENWIKNETTPDFILTKLKLKGQEFNWRLSKDIVIVLCNISPLLETERDTKSSISESAWEQSARYVSNLFLRFRREQHDEVFSLAKNIIRSCPRLEFVLQTISLFPPMEQDNSLQIFEQAEMTILEREILTRAIGDGTASLFKVGQFIPNLSKLAKTDDEEGFMRYTDKILRSDPRVIIDIVKGFSPLYVHVSTNGLLKSNLTKERYEAINDIFGKERIVNRILDLPFKDEILADKPSWNATSKGTDLDLNILRQYLYWAKLEADSEKEKSAGVV